MVLAKTEVEKIIKTLPVSYYAFKGLPVVLTDEERTYINRANGAISISYPMIRKVMEEADKKGVDVEIEKFCRFCLYHEISHALLTPPDMLMNPSYYNTFEDERIETVLANYYIDVDFKKNIMLLNGWDAAKPHEPRTADEAFYQTVRFRYGKKKHLEMVNAIIDDYSGLSAGDVRAYTMRLTRYEEQIKALYLIIAEDFEKEKKLEGEEKAFSLTDRYTEAESSTTFRKNYAEKRIEDAIEGIDYSYSICLNEAIFAIDKKIMKEYSNRYYDYFYPLFYSYNKRCGGGSATQSYSGTFNPRNAARDDYRFFDRLAHEKGNNRYGSMNLNLFIDTSGSFNRNQAQVNGLLEALERLENRFKFFTFELITCNVGQQLKRHSERRIGCIGGNWLDEGIKPIWRKVQKLNTSNYNVVLFDGNAYTDPKITHTPKAPMTVFDYANTTLITEYSNEDEARKCKHAKVVITNNYTEELERYVKRAIQFALS